MPKYALQKFFPNLLGQKTKTHAEDAKKIIANAKKAGSKVYDFRPNHFSIDTSKMEEQMRAEEILTERKKSANERELERFFKENREENIKIQLEEMRKMRDDDIKFNHNPLDTPNITKSKWELRIR